MQYIFIHGCVPIVMLVFGGVIGWNYFREFFEADAVLLEKPNQWILKRTLSPLVVGEQQVKRRQTLHVAKISSIFVCSGCVYGYRCWFWRNFLQTHPPNPLNTSIHLHLLFEKARGAFQRLPAIQEGPNRRGKLSSCPAGSINMLLFLTLSTHLAYLCIYIYRYWYPY